MKIVYLILLTVLLIIFMMIREVNPLFLLVIIIAISYVLPKALKQAIEYKKEIDENINRCC